MTRPSANILVIDDEKSVCVTCKRILEEEGHHVEYVLSGEDGVRTAESGRFDLALVDLRMPDLPGEQVLERIKAARPSMPIRSQILRSRSTQLSKLMHGLRVSRTRKLDDS